MRNIPDPISWRADRHCDCCDDDLQQEQCDDGLHEDDSNEWFNELEARGYDTDVEMI